MLQLNQALTRAIVGSGTAHACQKARSRQRSLQGMKILVISLAGIGDTLFATPLIHELRLSFPDASIDTLVLWPGAADLLKGNPHLDSVFQKDLLKDSIASNLHFLGLLRKRRYDFSINTHPQSRVHYRITARFINAARRISHSYDRPSPLDPFLVTDQVPQDYQIHCVENNLNLLPLVNQKPQLPDHQYELFLAEPEIAWAAQFLSQNHLAGKSIVAFHVGSGTTKNLALRRWPPDHYIRLIQKLNSTRPEIGILLLGGPGEIQDHELILQKVDRKKVFAPRTENLRQAAALLQHARVFVSVDTALMHLAAAAKVPRQICIETPSFNKTVEPYGRSFVLVQNPMINGRHLEMYRYDGKGLQASPARLMEIMASIPVEEVLLQVNKALDPQPAP